MGVWLTFMRSAELNVALDGGENRRVLGNLTQLLPFFGCQHAVDHGVDAAGFAPRFLLAEERIGHLVVLAQPIGRGRENGRLPRVLVLRQRKVVVHEPQFSLQRELFLHALDRLLVQRFARRAFEVAEEIDPDRGGDRPHRARRFGLCRRPAHDERGQQEDGCETFHDL